MVDYYSAIHKRMPCQGRLHEKPFRKKGPTSYHMHDQEYLFRELDIKQGDWFLDLGCGIGEYALHASKEVGPSGYVYALDIQKQAIDILTDNIKNQKIENIKAIVADIVNPLPIEDSTIDICLISTVLHALDWKTNGPVLFAELFRVLKAGARLVTIDCKKEEAALGPPLAIRIGPGELETMASQAGFERFKLIDLGSFYMYQFVVKKEGSSF